MQTAVQGSALCPTCLSSPVATATHPAYTYMSGTYAMYYTMTHGSTKSSASMAPKNSSRCPVSLHVLARAGPTQSAETRHTLCWRASSMPAKDKPAEGSHFTGPAALQLWRWSPLCGWACVTRPPLPRRRSQASAHHSNVRACIAILLNPNPLRSLALLGQGQRWQVRTPTRSANGPEQAQIPARAATAGPLLRHMADHAVAGSRAYGPR